VPGVETTGDGDEMYFFCKVKIVYIEDTSGDIERLKTQVALVAYF